MSGAERHVPEELALFEYKLLPQLLQLPVLCLDVFAFTGFIVFGFLVVLHLVIFHQEKCFCGKPAAISPSRIDRHQKARRDVSAQNFLDQQSACKSNCVRRVVARPFRRRAAL